MNYAHLVTYEEKLESSVKCILSRSWLIFPGYKCAQIPNPKCKLAYVSASY